VRAAGGTPATEPIRLTASRGPHGGWRVEVLDRGPGIAREDLPRLFEPFFTTRKTGSGLGLALARNIVEGLGGTITIDSAVGVGTTVRIDLPERPVEPSDHGRASRTNGAGIAGAPPLDRLRAT
jgi:signal transduction histidine kinase